MLIKIMFYRRILFLLLLLNIVVFTQLLQEKKFRILGGRVADKNKWQYLGSLTRNDVHYCGVTLIDSDCCLTAAHCVTDDSVDSMRSMLRSFVIDFANWRVRFGFFNISSKDGLYFEIKNIFVHPEFDRSTLNNDIALIKLKDSVSDTLNIIPVKLALDTPKYNTVCVTAGWGRIVSDYQYSRRFIAGESNLEPVRKFEDILRDEISLKEKLRKIKINSDSLLEVDLPIFSKEICNKIYRNRVTSSMICTLVNKGGKDACEGDSGGPLMCDGVQSGIISWGADCGGPTSPGVYTNVAYYTSWLRNKCNVVKTVTKRVLPRFTRTSTNSSKTHREFSIIILLLIIIL